MLETFEAVATIAVKDIGVATTFYEQTLGLIETSRPSRPRCPGISISLNFFLEIQLGKRTLDC